MFNYHYIDFNRIKTGAWEMTQMTGANCQHTWNMTSAKQNMLKSM